MTKTERLELLVKQLERLPSREYVSRQHLLMAIHHLKQKIDDDCPVQPGQ